MPFWLPFAILGALGALVVVSTSKKPGGGSNPSGQGTSPQELSMADKVALMKTLPTRFLVSDQSTDAAESMTLKAPGVAGEADAFATLFTLNMEGHAILVGKTPSGETQVLVPLKTGAEVAYAAPGSAWNIFLRPLEASNVVGQAGLAAPGVKTAQGDVTGPVKQLGQLGAGAVSMLANAQNPQQGQTDLVGAAQGAPQFQLHPLALAATTPASALPDSPDVLKRARTAYNHAVSNPSAYAVAFPQLASYAQQVGALGYTLAAQQLLTEARALGYQG